MSPVRALPNINSGPGLTFRSLMDAVAAPYPLRPAHRCRTAAGFDATRAHQNARRPGRREMGLETLSA